MWCSKHEQFKKLSRNLVLDSSSIETGLRTSKDNLPHPLLKQDPRHVTGNWFLKCALYNVKPEQQLRKTYLKFDIEFASP